LTILLFDIDGTLIRTGGAGRCSMEKALWTLFDIEDGFTGIPMMGRTDPEIFLEVLSKHGLPANRENERLLREKYFQYLEEEIKQDRPGKGLCPGVKDLLFVLQRRPGCLLGLLTGNYHRSAEIKLRHFGIDSFFLTGAYADDSPRRQDLVPFARRRFSELLKQRVTLSSLVVIGDTPRDVHCARTHGVKTVAVATGIHSRTELEAAHPDAVLDDFSNKKTALAALCDKNP